MIVTFYSFKGGVGRSMAMANVGAWLQQQGRRALLVDWDLEAPGIETFFLHDAEGLRAIRSKPGLVDLIDSYLHLWAHPSDVGESTKTPGEKAKFLTEQIGQIRHLFLPLNGTNPKAIETRGSGLWLLHAGYRADESAAYYTKRVNSLDWGRFYDEFGGFEFFEWLRLGLEKDVDIVLVDSRTGLTEMGGVCIQHLADVVVALFAPNDSNLQGIRRITESLLGPKVQSLRGPGRPLDVFPIPARVDTQGATTQLTEFQSAFRTAFKEFTQLNLDWCWNSMVRYVTSYSYSEEIVFGERTGHADLMHAYERIGNQIIRLYEEGLPIAERESQTRTRAARQGARPDNAERAQRTVEQMITTAREKTDSRDFDTAASLLRSAIQLAERDLGEEAPMTLASLKDLSAVYYAQGDFSAALQLLEKIAEIEERMLGPQHPDLSTSLNNLVRLHFRQGRYNEAEPIAQQSLAISEQVLGPEHPDTATTLNNLASLYTEQGRYNEAEPLLQRSLEAVVKISQVIRFNNRRIMLI